MKRRDYLLSNSKILHFFVFIYLKYSVFWENSQILKKINNFMIKLLNLSNNSNFLNFNYENNNKFIPQSKILSFLYSIFVSIVKNIYTFINIHLLTLQSSYTIRLINFLTINYIKILSFSISIIIITPHKYWNNLYSLVIALVLGVLLIVRIAKENIFKIKITNIYLIFFLLSVFLNFLFSLFPQLSLRTLIFYSTCLLFTFIIIISVNSQKDLMMILKSLIISLTLIGIYGIWQNISGVPIDPSQIDVTLNQGVNGRIYSTLENPNNFAEVIIMLIPFYFVFIENSKKLFSKFIYFCLFIPAILSLILSSSRSSWIAFAFSFIIFLLVKNRKILPLIFICAIASIPFLPFSIYKRILSIFNASKDSSMDYRMLIYQTMDPILSDYFFTGIGIGTDAVTKIVPRYFQYTEYIPPHSHNLYFQLTLETGLIGIASYIVYILSLLKKSVVLMYHSKNNLYRSILLAGIMSIISISIVSFVEYVWFYPRVMIVFWILCGVIMSSIYLQEKELSDNECIVSP